MHNPITRRIRSVVDGSFAHCHGGCEFEPHHCTFLFVFFRFYSLLIYLFFKDINVIHNHFQTNLVAEYCFNDI